MGDKPSPVLPPPKKPSGDGKVGAPAKACEAGKSADLNVTVTYRNDGKPVDKASVKAVGPSSASGVTKADGKVTLRGVKPSPPEYQVTGKKDAASDTKPAAAACGVPTNVSLTLPGPVKPLLTPKTLVTVVRKPYADGTWTTPRTQVTLKTDFPFDGSATLTCDAKDRIRIFDKDKAGTEVKLDGKANVFAGAKLNPAGIPLWIEGAQHSKKMDDIKLTLTLSGGTSVIGPPATATVTSVEVTLDVCMSRTKDGVAPSPMPQPPEKAKPGPSSDKIGLGRFIHIQDAGKNHGRAMLIVRKAEPPDFTGTLVLTPKDAKAGVFAAETGGAALATPQEFTNATIAKDGKNLWIEGATVSTALRDAGFRLGVKGISDDLDRVRVTVVEFSEIKATIHPTPPITVRAGFAAPADHSFSSKSYSEDFAVNVPLVLMRNAQPDTALEVTVKPAGLPIIWRAIRNKDDHKSLGKEGEVPAVTANAGNVTRATLNSNEKGSFYIRPFIDCNGSKKYGDKVPSIPLTLVLANATVVADNSKPAKNTAAAQPIKATINAANVSIQNGTWAGMATAGMAMELEVDVTGGGDKGMIGLNHVYSGLINVIDVLEWRGDYRDSTVAPPVNSSVKFIAPSNATTQGKTYGGKQLFTSADPAPVLHAVPLLDTGRNPNEGTGGEMAVMSRSGPLDAAPVPRAVGERRTIKCMDSPSTGFDKTHPSNANAVLFRVHQHVAFRACFCFWTNIKTPAPQRGATGDPADRLYSVLRIVPWDIVGDWNVNYPPAGPPAPPPPTMTATTAHDIVAPKSKRSTVKPIGRAQDHRVEVRAPSPIVIYAFDGR